MVEMIDIMISVLIGVLDFIIDVFINTLNFCDDNIDDTRVGLITAIWPWRRLSYCLMQFRIRQIFNIFLASDAI